MQSLNLSNLELAAKTALQRLVRPRFLHVVEPWVLRASSEERKLLMRLLRTLENAAREEALSGSATKIQCVVNENGVSVPVRETTCSIDALQMRPRDALRPRSAPAAVNLRTTHAEEIYSMNFLHISTEPCVARMCQHWVARAIDAYQISVHNRADTTLFLHLLRGIFAFAESLGRVRPQTAHGQRAGICVGERLFQTSKADRLIVEATAAVIQTRIRDDASKKKAAVIIGRRNIPLRHAAHVVQQKPVGINNIFLTSTRVAGTMQTTYARDFKPLHASSWRHVV